MTVTADYHIGRPSQAAVLLMHGFLQTHESEPMNALASNLFSKGYTTLSPTLSLGVNKRKQSMPCEAVHLHTIEEDVAEIDYWINWLLKKGHTHLALIGFSSTGNIEILLYNLQSARPAIKKTILVSLIPITFDVAERRKHYATRNAQQTSDIKTPELFSLGYCKKNFAASKKTYLSYTQFDEEKILQLIAKAPQPVDMIFGSADTTLPENWLHEIKSLPSQANIKIINNANHFFDALHEFELTDSVEKLLKDIPVSKP